MIFIYLKGVATTSENMFIENTWRGGLLPPHPQVNKPHTGGLRPPGPPAMYPSNPQNPQICFRCHSKANSIKNDRTSTGTQYYIITFY